MCLLAANVLCMVAILCIPETSKIVACLDGLLNNVCACLRVVKLYCRNYSNEQTRIKKFLLYLVHSASTLVPVYDCFFLNLISFVSCCLISTDHLNEAQGLDCGNLWS